MLLMRLRPQKISTSFVFIRNYSKKKKQQQNTATTMSSNKRMVHQEEMRYVNLYSRINIKSDINLKVQPADVLEYTNGDVLIAQLWGDAVKNCGVTMNIDVSDTKKAKSEVNICIEKLVEKSNFHCDLKVPVRAELHIRAMDNVRVEGINGEALNVNALGNIHTKKIQATKIALNSEKGDVKCDGMLLAKCTEIETNAGDIKLDKLQGDEINCKTISGGIQTDCCYTELSKFETESGHLQLKNVHKQCAVRVHNGGHLEMIGVHGNLSVNMQRGKLNLQLSELNGKCVIESNEPEEAIINISDDIRNNAHIRVVAKHIRLDASLNDLANMLNDDKTNLELEGSNKEQQELHICSNGGNGVQLGKQSWADMMCNSIGIK